MLQDLKDLRPLADFDGSRWEQFAVEAQDQDLRPVLGESLYYDMMTKFFNTLDPMYAEYQKLINGALWVYNGDNVYFDGIKPMLAYYTLARLVQNNQVNITRYGVVTKVNAQSEPADYQTVTRVVNEMRSNAVGYRLQVDDYLLNNQTVYTKYKGSVVGSATSFKFFKG